MKKRTIHLKLDVRVPEGITDRQVTNFVYQLLEVGVADALESSERADVEALDGADLVTQIDIDKPVVMK